MGEVRGKVLDFVFFPFVVPHRLIGSSRKEVSKEVSKRETAIVSAYCVCYHSISLDCKDFFIVL